MKKVILVICILMLALFAMAERVIAQEDMHCPNHTTNFKAEGSGTHNGISFTISGATVSFSEPVDFCVKAGTGNSGIITGDSFTVDWLNDGNQIPDISYIVIYTPNPTATPIEPTATPIEPTATPIEPTATPIEPTATPINPTVIPTDPPVREVSPTLAPMLMLSTGPKDSPTILIVATVFTTILAVVFGYVYMKRRDR